MAYRRKSYRRGKSYKKNGYTSRRRGKGSRRISRYRTSRGGIRL